MNKTIMKLAIVAAGLTSSLAFAEITDGKCADTFSGNVPNKFATVDADGNGEISKEEMSEYVAGGQLDNLFGRWDADGSGAMSEEEFCYR